MHASEYEQPMIQEIGHVQELTLQNKTDGASDGVLYNGNPIGNVSVA